MKQTEVDCEFLKKCCENLSNENRRLKKQVQDLRSSANPLFLQLQKPNTANIYSVCSSCQKMFRFKGGCGGGDDDDDDDGRAAGATDRGELGLYQAEPKKSPFL